MKILVTGSGGFIGSHLTEALLRRGDSVRAMVHYNGAGRLGHLDRLEPSLRARLDVVSGDIADPFFVREAVSGCDMVFHLAALIAIPHSYRAPASYVQTNVNGTLNVLEACRSLGIKRLLITSTSEVYGTARTVPINESHPLQAQSPYAASKIAADKLAESYYCSFDLPVTIVRPFNTYGPRQSARAVIPTIASQIAAGFSRIEIGALWPERDLTFVEDTVAGFLAISEYEGAFGEVINLGNGSKVSIGELANRLVNLSGRDIEIVSTAERSRPEKSEVGLLLADASKAIQLTDWKPKVTLDEGLNRVLEFVTKNLADYRPGEYQQ